MDERLRRLWAAAEARDLGRGGVTAVWLATRLSRSTVTAGQRELKLPAKKRTANAGRIWGPGAGRPRLLDSDPELLEALEARIEPRKRGSRQSPLRWSCLSTQQMSERLTHQGHPVSPRSVAALLHKLNYRLDNRRKPRNQTSDRRRRRQFDELNSQRGAY